MSERTHPAIGFAGGRRARRHWREDPGLNNDVGTFDEAL